MSMYISSDLCFERRFQWQHQYVCLQRIVFVPYKFRPFRCCCIMVSFQWSDVLVNARLRSDEFDVRLEFNDWYLPFLELQMLCTTLLKNMQLIYSDNMSLLSQTNANLNSDKCESQQMLQFQNVTVYDEWCIGVSARSFVSLCLDAKAIRQSEQH